MNEEILSKLNTPCIVVDVGKVKNNIHTMQQEISGLNCALRPHIKTHKMKKFAQMQIEAGACGITCAKVSEALVMAEGGLDDIFIAYPLIGELKLTMALQLHQKIKRLILAIDSEYCAKQLSAFAVKNNITFEVRLEVDTGAKRTGVTRDNAVTLAKQIAALDNLNLTGIYTFKSLIYKDAPTTDRQLAGEEEGLLMEGIADNIVKEGIHLADISAGSSPTGVSVAKTGLVNEVRPGTYIYKDYMLTCEGVADPEDIAVKIYATVVSTPQPDYAVIDGGTKTFPMDIMLNQPPYYYKGYAIVEGNENLALTRMNEEHGIITSLSGKTNLQVGQKLELIPIHVCTAINMQNEVYLYENGDVHLEKVDARGMLV